MKKMEEFIKELKVELKALTGNEYLLVVEKENEDDLADSIVTELSGCGLKPKLLFVTAYFKEYLLGRSIADIAPVILANEIPADMIINNQICFKLASGERHREALENVPHIKFRDMEIVFYVLLSNSQNGKIYECNITNDDMLQWGMTLEELYSLAKVNTPCLLPCHMDHICTYIENLHEDITGEPICHYDEVEQLVMKAMMPVYVLHDKTNLSGASTILYPEVLKNAYMLLKTEIAIIPFSRNEVLLVPKSFAEDKLRIEEEFFLCPCSDLDFLSDSVYYYDHITDQIELFSKSVK